MSKKEKEIFLLYEGLYYFFIGNLENSFKSYKNLLILSPSNKQAKIYLETLFQFEKHKKKSIQEPENGEKNNFNIENMIIQTLKKENELRGFNNYKDYLVKEIKENTDKNW